MKDYVKHYSEKYQENNPVWSIFNTIYSSFIIIEGDNKSILNLYKDIKKTCIKYIKNKKLTAKEKQCLVNLQSKIKRTSGKLTFSIEGDPTEDYELYDYVIDNYPSLCFNYCLLEKPDEDDNNEETTEMYVFQRENGPFTAKYFIENTDLTFNSLKAVLNWYSRKYPNITFTKDMFIENEYGSYFRTKDGKASYGIVKRDQYYYSRKIMTTKFIF